MDSSTRFRFRDSTNINSSSDDYSSSVSSGGNDESKLQSLTAKGVKRLCSELLELKKASDEDFHKSVYLDYSAFIRIFEQVEGVENELMQLKQHVSTQRAFVKDLTDNVYLEILSEESLDVTIGESTDCEQSPIDNMEAHAATVSEEMDILMSEQRLDEALVILEMEELSLKVIHLEENPCPQLLTAYESAISERKSRLTYQFAQVADHPRVSAPEFQKALSGLCRLGNGQCVTHLLIKFYRSRLENGVHDLRSSKSHLHRTYIRELAKFVFSTISQAARSFVLLHGEKSPYASELIQWAREETDVFASYFEKYVKSISKVNGGLLTAVEASQDAVSFCSILQAQCIVLCPYLVKLIRPCMEEVLKMHLDHYKQIISVFTANDDWVLGEHLISEILNDEASPILVGHKMEYILLTNSGRKLVTLLQDTMNEISPLIILQMESFILDGLLELFKEYIDNLEKSLPSKGGILERFSCRMVSDQTLPQQITLLANASGLAHIVPSTARSIFKRFKSQLIADPVAETILKDLDNWVFSIQTVSNQLKTSFYHHFIHRVMSLEGEAIFSAENYYADQGDSDDLMPSAAFQVLFLELRQIEKVGRDIFIEEDWLMELLRKLMESFFAWLENNEAFWISFNENSNFQQTYGFEQFVLDMQFLVEIARFGGYCSSNIVDASLALISHMESKYLSAGVNPFRDLLVGEWATNAANEAIQKLLESERSEALPNDGQKENLNTHENSYTSKSIEGDMSLLENIPELKAQLAGNESEGEFTFMPVLHMTEDIAKEEPIGHSIKEVLDGHSHEDTSNVEPIGKLTLPASEAEITVIPDFTELEEAANEKPTDELTVLASEAEIMVIPDIPKLEDTANEELVGHTHEEVLDGDSASKIVDCPLNLERQASDADSDDGAIGQLKVTENREPVSGSLMDIAGDSSDDYADMEVLVEEVYGSSSEDSLGSPDERTGDVDTATDCW